MAQIAVIKTGGKQYLVKVGDTLKVEKLDVKAGASVKFAPLLVADEDGKNVKVGAPEVKGAEVSAAIVGNGRAKKVTIVKYKSKVRYRRSAGHRQEYTAIKIEAIK
jgi:large subunit ribosomal protein L21